MPGLVAAERALFEGRKRVELVRASYSLGDQGLSQNRAASRLGVSPATLSRYRALYETALANGADPVEALAPRNRASGRPRAFKLTRREACELRALRLERGSFALAIEEFAQSPVCEPGTQALILERLDEAARRRKPPVWPRSLRRAGEVTGQEEALYRGKKHAQEQEFTTRRAPIWRDPEGVDRPMVPDLVWESDDYSTNAPYYIEDPERGGVRLCRQMLGTVDAHTYEGLTIEVVGRERDAYRAEDILRHMLRTIDGRGTMPMLWRIERGVWDSGPINGTKLPCGRVWGGLSALFHVEHTFKSKMKAHVEGFWDTLQSKVDHRSATIGRSRGEFELAANNALKINGRKRAVEEAEVRRLGFWAPEECAEVHRRAIAELNERPKQRQALGYISPADLRAQHPDLPARPLPESERWRFCAVKRPATVRGGHVEVKVEHYARSHRFQVNGVEPGVHLDNGYRILVAFDPAAPAEGCHIFNYEEGSRNREGYAFAERLLLAPVEADVPLVNFAGDGDHSGRKRASAAARTEFRAIMPVGRRAYSVSQSYDGEGNVQRTERGAQRPAPQAEETIYQPRAGGGSRGNPGSARKSVKGAAAHAAGGREGRHPEGGERSAAHPLTFMVDDD